MLTIEIAHPVDGQTEWSLSSQLGIYCICSGPLFNVIFLILNKADEVYGKFQQIHLFPELLHLEPKYQVRDTGFKLQPEYWLPCVLPGILQGILPHPPSSLIAICYIPLNMTHCAVSFRSSLKKNLLESSIYSIDEFYNTCKLGKHKLQG